MPDAARAEARRSGQAVPGPAALLLGAEEAEPWQVLVPVDDVGVDLWSVDAGVLAHHRAVDHDRHHAPPHIPVASTMMEFRLAMHGTSYGPLRSLTARII